jgi:hypothetical protein
MLGGGRWFQRFDDDDESLDEWIAHRVKYFVLSPFAVDSTVSVDVSLKESTMYMLTLCSTSRLLCIRQKF